MLTITPRAAPDPYDHARQNARAWLATIQLAYRAASGEHAAQQKLVDEGEIPPGADDDDRRDMVADAMRERPMSLEVRGGWHVPGGDDEPAEYRLLLTTGGPGLHLTGELSHGEAITAQLQMQDWGIVWRELEECGREDYDALLWFASLFYYGEG